MDITYLGYIAGTLTTAAFIPQVLKAWRTRSTESISLAMFLFFTLGVLLWLVYGLYLQSPPVILSNLITLILSVMIIWMKLRFK